MKQIILIISLFFVGLLQAQFQNVFSKTDSVTTQTKTIYLGFNDLAFVKNNEYFNFIADGYTLLGNDLLLDLHYRPHQAYQITAGVFLQKYFGLPNFEQPVPYFGLEIYNGHNTFYIGKLYTADNHQLADELYDFERHLDSRSVENGLQHRYKNTHWQTDTWLEWEHFIFKGDHRRERLNFGQTTVYRHHFGNWQWHPFLQIYLMHRGGQINLRTTDNNQKNNAMVIADYSMGTKLQYRFNKQFVIGFDYTFLGHRINSDNVEELHFRSGKAHKMRLFFKYKHWQNYAGYWQGHNFVAPKGNAMYQSISNRVDKYLDTQGNTIPVFKHYTEANRQLLTWTSVYHKEIYPHLHLGFVVDLYYQLNHSTIHSTVYSHQIDHQFDYATGLYLHYDFNFKLKKINN